MDKHKKQVVNLSTKDETSAAHASGAIVGRAFRFSGEAACPANVPEAERAAYFKRVAAGMQLVLSDGLKPAAPADAPKPLPLMSENAKKVYDFLSGRKVDKKITFETDLNIIGRTLSRALAELKRLGLVARYPGGGYYRPDAPPKS